MNTWDMQMLKKKEVCMKKTEKKSLTQCRHALWVLCLSGLVASMAGCDDNDTAKRQDECTEDAQCAGRTDGRTKCYLDAKICILPSTPAGPSCNGFPEAGEDCDGIYFKDNKQLCADWDSQYVAGKVKCVDCKLDYSDCLKTLPENCNGNAIDADEECDGEHFRLQDKSCAALHPSLYSSGEVTCDGCRLSYDNCVPIDHSTCKNNGVDAGEDCDGSAFRDDKTTCAAWYPTKFNTGNVGCNNCKLDITDCSFESAPTCGNKDINAGEDCDGNLFRDSKTTCAAWYPDKFNVGNVHCNGCKLDISECQYVASTTCNGKALDGDEDCDGTHFRNDKTTCAEWYPNQFNSGDVHCDSNCRLDISECKFEITTTCNGDALDADEMCDGKHFRDNRKKCSDWFPDKFNDGEVGCDDCKIDITNCRYVPPETCNGQGLDPLEDCDGTLFRDDKKTCAAWYPNQFNTGDVKCSNCRLDISECSYVPPETCDGNKIDNDELCDGTHFLGDKTTCQQWYPDKFNTGDVSCDHCKLDITKCKYVAPETCNGKSLDANEDCDGELFRNDKKTCADWYPKQFNTGDVKCNKCKLDISDCRWQPPETCDNSFLDKEEVCDGKLFQDGKTRCADWYPQLFNSGEVGCNHCMLDFSKCEKTATCNGYLEAGEECDGSYFKDNKILCSDWDSNYTQGMAKCKDCKVDLTSCSTCNGHAVDKGEECDGSHFVDNKTSCSDYDKEYTHGTVTCNANCTINYDNCMKECPDLTGWSAKKMEWSSEYQGCVYPVATKDDLLLLSKLWNEQGIDGFEKVTNGKYHSPIFVLKSDIDLGDIYGEGFTQTGYTKWEAIGREAYEFEGVFDGAGHTITAKMYNAPGLFGVVQYSDIKNVKLNINPAGKNDGYICSNLIAKNVIHSTISNIDFKGNLKYGTPSSAGILFHQLLDDVHISGFRIDMDITINVRFDNIGLFAYQTFNSSIDDIEFNLKSNFIDYDNYQYLSGLAYKTANDKYSNIRMNIDIISKQQYDAFHILFSQLTQGTSVDRVKITGGLDGVGGTDIDLINSTEETEHSIISNLYMDITADSNYAYMFYSLYYIDLVNASIRYNFRDFHGRYYGTDSKKTNIINSNFIDYQQFSFPQTDDDTIYLKNDKITAEIMNENLKAGAAKGIPAGTYLPWIKDDNDRIVLDFDARDSELIEVKGE